MKNNPDFDAGFMKGWDERLKQEINNKGFSEWLGGTVEAITWEERLRRDLNSLHSVARVAPADTMTAQAAKTRYRVKITETGIDGWVFYRSFSATIDAYSSKDAAEEAVHLSHFSIHGEKGCPDNHTGIATLIEVTS